MGLCERVSTPIFVFKGQLHITCVYQLPLRRLNHLQTKFSLVSQSLSQELLKNKICFAEQGLTNCVLEEEVTLSLFKGQWPTMRISLTLLL